MSTYYKWSFGLVFHVEWRVKDLGSLSCHGAGISPHFLSLVAVQLLPHNWPLHLLSSLSRCTLQAYSTDCSSFSSRVCSSGKPWKPPSPPGTLGSSFSTPRGPYPFPPYIPGLSPQPLLLATPSSRLSHKVPSTLLLNLYFFLWLLRVQGVYIKYLYLDA